MTFSLSLHFRSGLIDTVFKENVNSPFPCSEVPLKGEFCLYSCSASPPPDISVLPDGAVPAVRISSRHGAHLRATPCVLVDVHDIMVYREDGGLVHVPHRDFEGGSVFEGTEIGEARVHVCIHPLDVQSVGLLPLVVQRLFGEKEPRGEM